MFVGKSGRVFPVHLLLLAGLSLLLAGCFARGETYTGDYGSVALPQKAAMNSVRVDLPADWQVVQGLPGGDLVRLAFTNEALGGEGEVRCYGGFRSIGNIIASLREEALSRMTGAELVAGPLALGGNLLSETFERWEGTVVSKGQEIPATVYIGYNTNGMVCNFGFLVGFKGDHRRDFEPVFAAMLKTVGGS